MIYKHFDLPCTHGDAICTIRLKIPLNHIVRTYLNLYIKHGICVDSQTKCCQNMVRQPFLIALLDSGPLTSEIFVFGKLKQTFEFV